MCPFHSQVMLKPFCFIDGCKHLIYRCSIPRSMVQGKKSIESLKVESLEVQRKKSKSLNFLSALRVSVTRGEREFQFPTIPGNTSVQKLGMIFSFPFPLQEVGNDIFHFRSCSQNLGMQFSIPIPVTGNGLSKSGIRTGIELKRCKKDGF